MQQKKTNCKNSGEKRLSLSLVTAIRDIYSIVTPTEVCSSITQHLGALLQASQVTLTLRDDGDSFRVAAALVPLYTNEATSVGEKIMVPKHSLSNLVLLNKKPVTWVRHLSEPIDWLINDYYLAVPIFNDEHEVYGAFALAFNNEDGFALENILTAEILADTFYHAHRNSLAYSASFTRGQTAEQQRISRELHDSIAQSVFGACMVIEKLLMASSLDEDTYMQVAKLHAIICKMRDDLCEIITSKSHAYTQETEIMALIQHEKVLHQSQSNLKVATCVDVNEDLPNRILAIIRAVVREALCNARKHSQAKQVVITVSLLDSILYLSIETEER
ncbi:MAG: histidine kinase [Coriobacteriales bacterium]|nr:histidine kinase [Coriobacteriales bacterium]